MPHSAPTREDRLRELGLELPAMNAPVANYVPGVITGRLLFVSGQLPVRDGALLGHGTVPGVVSVEVATACARQCALNALAVVHAMVGSLDRVRRVVRVGVWVASDPGFEGQPAVANGASDLLVAVFGEAGRHARAAVGSVALPRGAAVELDLVVELHEGA